ncbi:MAG: YajQ family cyclic di-GMP-binding protein [Dehalococcoidia bacterium]|nr:YajQ family cyclic di-GMP-binding protein [Dehalococcoidia bacterium]
MAKDQSFDVTTGCDLQEVENALNQARRELTGRFDFKGVLVEIESDRAEGTIQLRTADRYKLEAIWSMLVERLVARKVPLQNLKRAEPQPATGGTVRQVVTLLQGIDAETAKRITKSVRDQKLKGVQTQIQGDAVRVSGPNRDDLQTVMQSLRQQDWGIELSFGNYR